MTKSKGKGIKVHTCKMEDGCAYIRCKQCKWMTGVPPGHYPIYRITTWVTGSDFACQRPVRTAPVLLVQLLRTLCK